MKNKILALLEQDSHLTAAKIAVMLGKDEAEVKAAITELENDNIILGYKTLVNWELTDRQLNIAHLELKITPQRDCGFAGDAQHAVAIWTIGGDFEIDDHIVKV